MLEPGASGTAGSRARIGGAWGCTTDCPGKCFRNNNTHALDVASLASSMTSIEQVLEEVHPEDAKLSTKMISKRPSSRVSTGKIVQKNIYKIFKLTSLL